MKLNADEAIPQPSPLPPWFALFDVVIELPYGLWRLAEPGRTVGGRERRLDTKATESALGAMQRGGRLVVAAGNAIKVMQGKGMAKAPAAAPAAAKPASHPEGASATDTNAAPTEHI